MIVVDTSALIAFLFEEPDSNIYENAIRAADKAVVGAPTAFEAKLVMVKKRGTEAAAFVDDLLKLWKIDVLPWTFEHAELATQALIEFGGAPARLNMGDCMAYAIARSLNAPLLFKGDDFTATDIRSALPPLS